MTITTDTPVKTLALNRRPVLYSGRQIDNPAVAWAVVAVVSVTPLRPEVEVEYQLCHTGDTGPWGWEEQGTYESFQNATAAAPPVAWSIPEHGAKR